MASQSKTRQAIATIDREIGEQTVLDMLAEGKSQRAVAAYVSKQLGRDVSCYYINRYIHATPERSEKYRAARLIAAQVAVDRLGEITEELLAGRRDAPSVKVASDNLKWTASKLDPATYSDRVQVEATVMNLTELHLQSMRDAMRGQVISVEAAPDTSPASA